MPHVHALLLLSLLSTHLFAAHWNIEFKGGVAVSSLYGEDLGTAIYDNKKPQPSFIASLAVPISLNELFTLQPEVAYLTRGATLKGTIQKELHRRYLDLPVLARFNVNRNSFFSPYLYTGPTLSILLSASEESLVDAPTNDDPRTYITPLDFSLTFGAGVQFSAGPGAVLVDLRYNRGLVSTLNSDDWNAHHPIPEDQIHNDLTVKNITMSVMVGYTLQF